MQDEIKMAYNRKGLDINNFIWKDKKEYIGNEVYQDQVKMVDCSEEQLKSFYNRCQTMLYNNDVVNPGRYILLDIIQEQRIKCNIELFIRWINEVGGIPKFKFLDSLKTFFKENKEGFDEAGISTDDFPIGKIINNCPVEFYDLPSGDVIKGCVDQLGKFNKKAITLSFIFKQGIWFTSSESKDLTEKDDKGNIKDKLEVVRERLKLKSLDNIKINSRGLTYTEFRAMITLRSKKYSELTSDQLRTLRDKILFLLEDQCQLHISQWEERKRQIELVSQHKGYSL